jgi:prefoldin subunit 5
LDLDNILEQINSLLLELQAEKNELSKKVSELDKAVSKLYHEIEVSKYSTVSGYKTLVNLQGILIERRHYKNQLSLVRSAADTLTEAFGKVKKTKSRIYRKSEQNLESGQLTLVKNM